MYYLALKNTGQSSRYFILENTDILVHIVKEKLFLYQITQCITEFIKAEFSEKEKHFMTLDTIHKIKDKDENYI